MTSLLRTLAAMLGAHIQRDDLPPADLIWPDEQETAPVLDLDAAIERERRYAELATAMHAEIERQRQLVVDAERPCWACGDNAGFSGKHQCGRTWVRADGSTT